jgi:hypothetical protein
MKKLIFIFFLQILFFNKLAQAYINEYALKMAAAYTYTRVSQIEITDSLPLGFGISSHIGYKFTDYEINMSSYLNFSKLKAMNIEASNSSIRGDGNFQSVTFGPTFRYYLNSSPTKYGTPYFLGGVHRVIQTMKFGVNNVRIDGGNFNQFHKLTFDGAGGLIGFGLDRDAKKADNYFMEIVYILNKSTKTTEVAGETEVKLIRAEKPRKGVFENTFFISLGMSIF